MSHRRPEQIDSHEKCVGYRREVKRQTRRLLRRLRRVDPENAPRRARDVTWGYTG